MVKKNNQKKARHEHKHSAYDAHYEIAYRIINNPFTYTQGTNEKGRKRL